MTEQRTETVTFAAMLILAGVPRHEQYYTLHPQEDLVASGLHTLAEFEQDRRTASILDHLGELKLRSEEIDVHVFAAPGEYLGHTSDRAMPLNRPIIYRPGARRRRGRDVPARLWIDGGAEASAVLEELGIMFDSWRATGERHPWGADVVPCEQWCVSDHKMTDTAVCFAEVASGNSERHFYGHWRVTLERARNFGAWKEPAPVINVSGFRSANPGEAVEVAKALQLAAEIACFSGLSSNPRAAGNG